MKKFIQIYSRDSNCPDQLVADGLIESNNIIRIVGTYQKDKGVYYKVKLTDKEVNAPLLWTFIGFAIGALFLALITVIPLSSNTTSSSSGTVATAMMDLAYTAAAISSIFLFLLIPYGKVNICTYINEAAYKELNQ